MAQEQLGVGVIGAGKIGTFRAQLCAKSPYVKKLVIADKVESKAKTLAETCNGAEWTQSHEEAIERNDVDAVIVSTGETEHFDPTHFALKLRKPTLVEKPLVTNLEGADKLVKLAESSNTPLFVGYTQRLRRKFMLVKDSIEKGYVGNISTAFGRIDVTQGVANAIIERSPGVTPAMDILTYQIDMMLWFIQKEPVRVYAQSSNLVFGRKTKDATWAIVNFSDGTVACLGTSWISPEIHPAFVGSIDMQIIGTKGSMFVSDRHEDFLLCTSEAVPSSYIPATSVKVAYPESGMAGEWSLGRFNGPMSYETELFLEHLTQGTKVPNATGREARNTLEMCLAIDLSADKGVPIELPLKL